MFFFYQTLTFISNNNLVVNFTYLLIHPVYISINQININVEPIITVIFDAPYRGGHECIRRSLENRLFRIKVGGNFIGFPLLF